MEPSLSFSNKSVKKITLVDDDPDDRELFSYVVESRCNYNINLKTYIGGVELLDEIASNPHAIPDVLFLDINMPRLNGLECLKKLRECEDCKKTRIIMYSTSSSELDVKQSQLLGADLYLKKPNDIKKMGEVICKLIHTDWLSFVADKFVH